ncbi:Putative cyclase [Moorella glycerini]|uniref:Kynurenine formamidase n=1 Tax=Neomoorella stamsii TaxID=1266720 RepID=A0A9X7J4M5_9FIRM|nr:MULTISPECIES: cyclase family protein [Moorella]PRR73407.1 Kynurenine formamidase [Moorella stamsii]CEP69176.1 Putative cyclase [Moorella glycerini]
MKRFVDLTQPWSIKTPPFPTYPAPIVQYIKRLSTNRVVAQRVETTMHVGTHLDGPLHFVDSGRDIASIPLERLIGPGVVVDISDEVGPYEIYRPENITKKVEVKKGDVLIIHTGFHHYSCESKDFDEDAYFCKHPGPTREFAEWALAMELRWIGVDCGSADHPMNTVVRSLRPDHAARVEKVIGRPLDDAFPPEDYQVMHFHLFPHELIHVENIGGDIDELLNQRINLIGVFPWKFVGGEASICRVVAFLDI